MGVDSGIPSAFFAPLRLQPNPVYRFYMGGALMAHFRGVDGGGDSEYPEDWLGSVTRASNPPEHARRDEGLSVVVSGGRRALLRDLLEQDPAAVAGADVVSEYGVTTALLVKLLDAATRLPVHNHPTRDFAQRVLGSRFGKAEAWLILATRHVAGEEEPNIRLGFKQDMDPRHLLALVEGQDRMQLLASLNRIEVHPGDAFFVRPGLPHAIGAGVLLAEVQEPTDYSIVLEWEGYPIRPDEANLGRSWQTMIGSIDTTGVSGDGCQRLVQHPSLLRKESGMELHSLLGEGSEAYFRAFRVRLTKPTPWPTAGIYAVGVVTAGRLAVSNSLGKEELGRGEAVILLGGAPMAMLDGDGEISIFTPPFEGTTHLAS
jgi:mannose-6-phosphate isomerase